MRILLVDDDEWIRDSLRLYFKSEGCHLVARETGEEGIDALEDQDYDVIIVDYRLPGMDGLEFFERIKDSHTHSIKILITAYGNKQLLTRAMKLGIQDYLEKPFTSGMIETSLSKLIKNRG